MKKTVKAVSVLLTVMLIAALIPVAAHAESIFSERVRQLRSKFPNGGYWNHAVYSDGARADVLLNNWDNSYGDYTSGTPCATHNGQPGYGQYDCNVFDGGMQCWGFANRIFYGIWDNYASRQSIRYDTQNVSVGDWIRLENNNHSAVVLTRNGDYLTIVEGNRDGNCKIVWDRQIHISTINYFKHAPNWDEYMRERNADLGSDFYAYIVKLDSWKHVTMTPEKKQEQQGENCGNVELASSNSFDPKQIWHFTRNADESYTIVNCYDDSVLESYEARTGWQTNVQTAPVDQGKANQKWFLRKNGDGYNLLVGNCSLVFDAFNNDNAAGTNIELYENNGTGAQRFSVYKLETDGVTYAKPAKPDAPTGIKAEKAGDKLRVTWNDSPLKHERLDARTYTLEIWSGATASGTPVVSETGLTDTAFDATLSAGQYVVRVTAVNTKYANHQTASADAVVNAGPVALRAADVTLSFSSANYTGKAMNPSVTVKDMYGNKLTKNVDYTVTIPSGRTEIGTYKYVIKGKGNYTGTKVKTLTVTAAPLRSADVTLSFSSASYTGSALNPSVTVKNAAGEKLTKNVDYTVTIPSGRTEIGTYKYVITGKGHYTGSKVKTLTVTGNFLRPADVTLSFASAVYTGSAFSPAVTVKNAAGEKLTKNVDYTVTIPAGRTKVGSYTYEITGKGIYAGTVKKTFTVKPIALNASKVALSFSVAAYTGKAFSPSVTVKNAAGEKLTKNVDYTVTIPAGRTKVGTYTYVIKGIGIYGGTVEKTLTVKSK